jgi:hypothetical protein
MPLFQSVLETPTSDRQKSGLQSTMRKFKNPTLNKYIPPDESLGNMLTWGDKLISKPMDEVDNIHAIDYDKKRKSIIQRTTKKRRITLDLSILITTTEHLIDTKHAKISELISTGRVITDGTLNRDKKYEEELVFSLKELQNLRHLVKYYQDTTRVVMFLRNEFQDAYRKFTDE